MDEPKTTEITGAQPSPESRERIADLFAQLTRTLLAFKLYAPANQLRLEMFAELKRRVDAVFELEELVVVEIEPTALLWFGEPVIELREQENSFVFLLYKDGARQLGFKRGLDEGEIAKFLELLQARPEALDPTYSVVDTLWEADFKHIMHLAVDGFTEMLDDAEVDPKITGLATRFERLISDLVGRPQTEARSQQVARISASHVAADLPPEAPEETLIRVSDTIASPIRAFLVEPSAAEGESFDAWVEAAAGQEDELLSTVEALLLHWLESEETSLSDEEFVTLLTRLTQRRLARGNFAVAGELLTRLGHLRFELPDRSGIAHAVLSEISGAALRELILSDEGLEEAVWDLSEAVRFFDRHLAVGDEEILELVSHDLGSKSGRLLGQMLTQRVAERPEIWADHFRTIAPAVAAVSLASLATLHHTKPQVLDVFQRAFEHSDGGVRLAALRCYPGPYDDSFREVLLAQLDSDEVEVRCAAIDRLGESTDRSLGAFLVNRVRREGLTGLHPDEVQALTRAILGLGPSRYTPFFRGLLEHAGVYKGREPKELAGQVRALLGALATSRAAAPLELLREVRGRARGDLREWCDDLWRTVLADWQPVDQIGPGLDDIQPAEPALPRASSELTPTSSSAPPIAGLRELPDEAPEDIETLDEAFATYFDEVEDD